MEWLLIAAAVLLGVPAAAWLAQDRLIFYPQPLLSTEHLPPDARPLEVVAADGTRLHGWMRVPERTPAPVVIYFGGNAEEVSWTLADRRWPRDWAVVAVNYRGYGRSEGQPGETAMVADALAIHAAVVARPDADARRIVVFGRSLGSGVAIRLAAERPVSGAILASPYDSLVELGRTHFPLLPVAWLLRHRFDVLASARQLDIPLLAIVAADDAIIPQQRSQALYEAWAGPKQWLSVEGTDHNSLSVPMAFWSAVARFLGARGAEPGSGLPPIAIGAEVAGGAAGRR
jgi:pimeloyl-ACP methyl ester carboxylesterase